MHLTGCAHVHVDVHESFINKGYHIRPILSPSLREPNRYHTTNSTPTISVSLTILCTTSGICHARFFCMCLHANINFGVYIGHWAYTQFKSTCNCLSNEPLLMPVARAADPQRMRECSTPDLLSRWPL